MKAYAIVAVTTLVVAGLSVALWAMSDGVLDETTLSMDRNRANAQSVHGTGAYLVRLGTLEAGESVLVRVEFRDGANGTATVRPQHELEELEAPSPDGALARGDGNVIEFTFTATESDAYALLVEAPGETPRGKFRITWDPVQSTDRNPVYLGVARSVGLLGGGAAAVLFFAARARARRDGPPQ